MLDIQYIKSNKEELIENIKNRQHDPSIVDSLLETEKIRAEKKKLLEEQNHEKNINAEKLQSISDKSSKEARDLIKEGRGIKESIQNLDEEFKEIDSKYHELMLRIPNIVDPSMPIGKSSEDNVEIKVVKQTRSFDFPPKDHIQLGKILDIIDVERSTKVSGSRFSFLKNEAVLLEFAIITFLTQKLLKKGFSPIIPPVLVKERALYGTGYFPMEESQVYKISSDNIEEGNQLYLSGTGEVPTVSYHADEIFEKDKLPIKYFAFSSCFRSEVGSWGKDVRGIKRVHQFDKLEMVVFSLPEESSSIHEELLSINEEFLNDLKLPYHVLNMCSGDVGFPTYKKYDVEVYLPSQNDYCETMSTSNIHAYQARRLNIKYRNEDGKLDYIHTLNSTAAAIGRILIAIIENYQEEDGSVRIPDVLLPYMSPFTKEKFIKPKAV